MHGILRPIPFRIQIILLFQKRWKNGQFDLFKPLLPRIYMIIEEINERFCKDLWKIYPGNWDRIDQMSIISRTDE